MMAVSQSSENPTSLTAENVVYLLMSPSAERSFEVWSTASKWTSSWDYSQHLNTTPAYFYAWQVKKIASVYKIKPIVKLNNVPWAYML